MKILHISSDYAGSKVCRNLVSELSRSCEHQTVFVPVRTEAEVGVNALEDLRNVTFIYDHLLRPYHRLLYNLKIEQVRRSICSSVAVEDYELVHSHFLYSDGGVAYHLKQQFGIPYIVTVRNTDLNFFRKYRPDLNGFCDKILTEASQIVFLTPAYKQRFLGCLSTKVRSNIEVRCSVVPNAIECNWFTDNPPRIDSKDRPFTVVATSDFSAWKNLKNVVGAAERFAEKSPVNVILVGAAESKGRSYERQFAPSHPDCNVQIQGRMSVDELKLVYAKSDLFVLPSFYESFGLVYLEALSQGLPIVHGEGEGLGGVIDDASIVHAVNPKNVNAIAQVMHDVHKSRPDEHKCRQAAAKFRWDYVSNLLLEIYEAVVRVQFPSGQ